MPLGPVIVTVEIDGKIETFTFSWRDDLRKDEAWYARQLEDLDPVTVAQEIDIDYSASVEGVVIPSMWVQACINARQKLGLSISGGKYAALDVADPPSDVRASADYRRHLVPIYVRRVLTELRDGAGT